MAADTAADDKAIIMKPCGVAGEDALTGGKNTSAEDAPLTAVRVTRYNKIDRQVFEIGCVVFRMVAEKEFEATLGRKRFEIVKIRGRCFSEMSLFAKRKSRGKTTDGELLILCCLIFQKDNACFFNGGNIFILKKVVIAVGLKGGGNFGK